MPPAAGDDFHFELSLGPDSALLCNECQYVQQLLREVGSSTTRSMLLYFPRSFIVARLFLDDHVLAQGRAG